MQTNPQSDASAQKKREHMPKVSFVRDIRPHEGARHKVHDYTFMSKPGNADKVFRTLSRMVTTRLPCHPAVPIGQKTSSRCSPSGRRTDTSHKDSLCLIRKSRSSLSTRIQRSPIRSAPTTIC
jgi:hypothetical protein